MSLHVRGPCRYWHFANKKGSRAAGPERLPTCLTKFCMAREPAAYKLKTNPQA